MARATVCGLTPYSRARALRFTTSPPFSSTRAGASAGEGARVADEERSVTDTQADEMEEHLRGFGYLE